MNSHELRQRMVDDLVRDRALDDPAWIKAFAAVPRELFAPRYFTYAPERGCVPVASTDHGWLETIYADRVLPIQLDADPGAWDRARQSRKPADGVATCSLSQPSLTAAMLEKLEVADAAQILEIGTGTGYQAALLSERLGDKGITTVDIDPSLTDSAVAALNLGGYHPRVLTRDGNLGVIEWAPFDRIIATCSFRAVPTPWLGQLRNGGMILTDVYRTLFGGFIVCLVVDTDSASGYLADIDGSYMPDRNQPTSLATGLLRAAVRDGEGIRRSTELRIDPHRPEPWHVLADLSLPDATTVDVTPTHGSPAQWLLHPDGSWAVCDSATKVVEQNGPQRLWDIAERAYGRWEALDRPTRDQFGLTVGLDGRQTLWIDEPGNTITTVPR